MYFLCRNTCYICNDNINTLYSSTKTLDNPKTSGNRPADYPNKTLFIVKLRLFFCFFKY